MASSRRKTEVQPPSGRVYADVLRDVSEMKTSVHKIKVMRRILKELDEISDINMRIAMLPKDTAVFRKDIESAVENQRYVAIAYMTLFDLLNDDTGLQNMIIREPQL